LNSIGFTNIEVNNYTGTKEIVDIENQLGDIFKLRGEMGGQSLYIKKDSDLDMEIGQSLHNYPVLDDDMHAKVQAELKEEAFDDYGEREIRKLIEYKYESINHMKLDKDLDFDIDDNFSDEEIKNIWEKTLEKNANDRGDLFFFPHHLFKFVNSKCI
jgi:phosphoribosylformylglycinamidine (FGAM) synthase PurS component